MLLQIIVAQYESNCSSNRWLQVQIWSGTALKVSEGETVAFSFCREKARDFSVLEAEGLSEVLHFTEALVLMSGVSLPDDFQMCLSERALTVPCNRRYCQRHNRECGFHFVSSAHVLSLY